MPAIRGSERRGDVSLGKKMYIYASLQSPNLIKCLVNYLPGVPSKSIQIISREIRFHALLISEERFGEKARFCSYYFEEVPASR